ncbi:MAG: hypothetical protein RBU37_25695 [Myxococcota bacterium]|nr:hypothetical protein [Myxococcota bacterium]
MSDTLRTVSRFVCLFVFVSAMSLGVWSGDSHAQTPDSTAAERQAAYDADRAKYDDVFFAEARDADWADASEALAAASIESVGGTVTELECRTSFCRMVFSIPAHGERRTALDTLMSEGEGVFQQYCSAYRLGEPSTTVNWYFICSRDGFSLPDIE